MNYENLRLLRNILYRWFAIGLVIIILIALAAVGGWATWTDMANRWFGVDAALLGRMMLGFLFHVRFFLLFILLAPALALHWTLKRENRRK